MDEEDEKHINKQMTLLQSKQQTLTHAVRNQLKILNATVTHVSDLEKNIKNNDKRLYNLDARIYNSILLVIQRNKWINSKEINEYYTIISKMIANLERNIQNMYNFSTFAANKILHPQC